MIHLQAIVLVLAAAAAAKTPAEPLVAGTGTIVRWSVPGTTRCSMEKRTWAALLETCYYPIDLLHKPGIVTVSRRGARGTEVARIRVETHDYGSENVELGDIPQAHPSAADLDRNVKEQARLAKIWRHEGKAAFTLPLGAPVHPLPEAKAFGAARTFNGKPADQPHMGADYPAPQGSIVAAVADGKVVVAEDLFYPGNAVILDHGDGLLTMYFHLADIKVEVGQAVKKGALLGHVGATGRATGPHLFFGVRWHDARLDPSPLMRDPARIPAIEPR
jgi:murein DD-endopeptidase MepM/ murein hydrolase activator NlpD